jgi:phytoene dehydrogenase-like protein
MTDRYDVLLVGAGHNGLVCAHYLARAGRRVLVLEVRDEPGGCAATREFAPGYSVSACAQWLNQLHPDIMQDLALENSGLEWAARDLETISLDREGQHLTLLGDRVEGERVSREDREAYRVFHARTSKYVKLLRKAFEARAPKLVESNVTDRLNLLKLGLGLKLLGREGMSDLMRVILINMYDLMEESFDSAQLKALLSLDSLLGAHMGPRTPNTVFGYLYRRLGDSFGHHGPAVLKGGMGALGKAMAASARAAGVEIRTGERVTSIDLEAGRVCGVTLASGEQLRAPVVISNADPVTTFEKLVGYRNIETGVARRVSQIRFNSGTVKLHLALDRLPDFPGLSEQQLGQRLVIAPDMDYIESAFNAVKYREYSTAPVMDISIPSLHDRSLAPEEGHVLSAIIQFAPYAPNEGWEACRERYIEQLIACIADYAPDIGQRIVAAELLTPADLENDFGMTGGHWHHGELSMDQVLMMRPFPGATQYATPCDGLYLCGAGAHPGGGVMGLAGRNAAREILRRGDAA